MVILHDGRNTININGLHCVEYESAANILLSWLKETLIKSVPTCIAQIHSPTVIVSRGNSLYRSKI